MLILMEYHYALLVKITIDFAIEILYAQKYKKKINSPLPFPAEILWLLLFLFPPARIQMYRYVSSVMMHY